MGQMSRSTERMSSFMKSSSLETGKQMQSNNEPSTITLPLNKNDFSWCSRHFLDYKVYRVQVDTVLTNQQYNNIK